tara:strand:- start:1305 stop:1808 length:504 start_codon:yes stop_codon:yes gene_type:complete
MPHATNSSFASVQHQTLNNSVNPPYMLSTTPHLASKNPGHSASTSLALYERSFQGPFPYISTVDFNIKAPSSNKLLVTPVPFRGGATKKKTTKKKPGSIKKKKPVSIKKKKTVSIKKKKVSIKKKKVVSIKKKKVVGIKKKKVSIKKKKVLIKKKKINGGINPSVSK